jgi:hypothetical protein
MRIAYWTVDEVNLSLAWGLGEIYDATIDQVMGREKDSTQDADAILYDLDFLPPTMREEILSCLILSRPTVPVAVHSYNLEESQVELLVAQGVAVYRHLEAVVFGNLHAAVLHVPVVAFRKTHREEREPAFSTDAALPAIEGN